MNMWPNFCVFFCSLHLCLKNKNKCKSPPPHTHNCYNKKIWISNTHVEYLERQTDNFRFNWNVLQLLLQFRSSSFCLRYKNSCLEVTVPSTQLKKTRGLCSFHTPVMACSITSRARWRCFAFGWWTLRQRICHCQLLHRLLPVIQ